MIDRTRMIDELFAKLFLLGGFIGATDTYKRTMWSAVPEIATLPATYTLTMRKGLPEPGADDQLIMAGHEAMLAQWFHRPLRRSDIESARAWFSQHSSVKAFPHAAWDAVLAWQSGEDIFLPIDVYGFAGGQAFRRALTGCGAWVTWAARISWLLIPVNGGRPVNSS